MSKLISTHEKYRETLNKVVMLDIIYIALSELETHFILADWTSTRIVYTIHEDDIKDISDVFFNFWIKCFRNSERKALQIKVGLLNRKINKEIEFNECVTTYANDLQYMKEKLIERYCIA